MNTRMDLTGKTAMITGGGRGIRRAIAVAMANAEVDVVMTARTAAQIDAVAGEIRDGGKVST